MGKLILLICFILTLGCEKVDTRQQCVSETPKGWPTWEEDNGKTICWKSKGFQCAPKCEVG